MALERAEYELGFEHVAAVPLVCSGYHANDHKRRRAASGVDAYSTIVNASGALRDCPAALAAAIVTVYLPVLSFFEREIRP